MYLLHHNAGKKYSASQRTDHISKGLKPRLSDKEPGNTFSILPILSPVTNIMLKRGNTKSTGKAHAYSVSPGRGNKRMLALSSTTS